MPNKPPRKEPRIPANDAYVTPVYRSPIVLGIAGILVILLIAGFVLYGSVQARSEEKQYDAAIGELGEAQYAKAIKRFDKLLEEFPDGKFAGDATVWRGIAKVRQFADSSTPIWANAHDEFQALVTEFKPTKIFKSQSKALADIEARIAAGLAGLARVTADQSILDKSIASLKQLEETFEKDAWPIDKMTEARSAIAQARVAIDQAKAKTTIVETMKKAIDEKDPLKALGDLKKTLARYADLGSDETLLQLKKSARAAEKELVKVVAFEPAKPTPIEIKPVPARTFVRKSAVEGIKPAGEFFPLLIEDALYSIDAGNGDIAWRQIVGKGASFYPVQNAGNKKNWLIHRPADNSVILLEAKTGKAIWSTSVMPMTLKLGSQPTIVGDQVFLVASQESKEIQGHLLALSLADGTIKGKVEFPQPIVASPVHDSARQTLLVLGKQSTLYTLRLTDLSCEQTVDLDHAVDAIRSTPVLEGRFLFIVESKGNERSQLRCYVLSTSDGQEKVRQTVSLSGWVWFPPAIAGGRLVLTTDTSLFVAFDLGGEEDKTPMTEVFRSATPESKRADQDALVVINENEFWSVGKRGRHYQLRQKEAPTAPAFEVEFEGPIVGRPAFIAGSMISAHRAEATGAIAVTALEPSKRTVQWKIELGAVAGALQMLPKESAISAVFPEQSRRFAADAGTKDELVVEAWPTKPATGRTAILWPVKPIPGWQEGILTWSSVGKGQLMVTSLSGERSVLPLAAGPAEQPIIFGKGVLFVGKDQLLYWIDPAKGTESADPFVAPFEQGTPAKVTSPIVLSDTEIALAVGRSVHRLQIRREGFPHFVSVAQTEVSKEPIASMLRLADSLWVHAGKELVKLALDKFTVGERMDLGASLVEPAHPWGGMILARTNRRELLLLNPAIKESKDRIVWRLPIDRDAVVLPADKVCYVIDANGKVSAYDQASGEDRGKSGFGRDIRPVVLNAGDRLWASAADGSILSLPIPSNEKGTPTP